MLVSSVLQGIGRENFNVNIQYAARATRHRHMTLDYFPIPNFVLF